MKASIKDIKKLREETRAGVVDIKKALEESGGDFKKAKDILKKKGLSSVEKRKNRSTSEGLIEAYIHADCKTGVLVELLCETDFVARNEEFKNLAHELAMQVAAMDPKDVNDLLDQPWIKDQSITIEDLVKEVAAKVGENMIVKRFTRFKLGEE